jgi:hypothetical protein
LKVEQGQKIAKNDMIQLYIFFQITQFKMKRRKLNEVDVFDIQRLPDVPFRRVLFFLPATDTGNMRCLSKG